MKTGRKEARHTRKIGRMVGRGFSRLKTGCPGLSESPVLHLIFIFLQSHLIGHRLIEVHASTCTAQWTIPVQVGQPRRATCAPNHVQWLSLPDSGGVCRFFCGC